MKIIETPSPNYGHRKPGTKINSIVLHYTGMKTADSALRRMMDGQYEVSAHYCVDENGDIYRLVDEKYKAWHAGASYWRGSDGLNDNSIGIEIVNKGHEHGYSEFPEAQMDSVIKLCHDIMARNDIDQKYIVGHSDIAPDRKEDPGELFPWKILAEENIGIYHTINYDDNFKYRAPNISDGEESKDIGEMQRKLNTLGYKIQKSTIFDDQTRKVVAAFYRRFMPERISLSSDARDPENIKWDGLSDIVLNDLFQKFN